MLHATLFFIFESINTQHLLSKLQYITLYSGEIFIYLFLNCTGKLVQKPQLLHLKKLKFHRNSSIDL